MSVVHFESPFHVNHVEIVANKMALKLDLLVLVVRSIQTKQLSDSEAVEILEVKKSALKRILSYKFERFSIDELLDYLFKLDIRVRLVIAENRL